MPLLEEALAINAADQPVRAYEAKDQRLNGDGAVANFGVSEVDADQEPVPRPHVQEKARVDQAQVEGFAGDLAQSHLVGSVRKDRAQRYQQILVVQLGIALRQDAPYHRILGPDEPCGLIFTFAQPVVELAVLEGRRALLEVGGKNGEFLARLRQRPRREAQAVVKAFRVGLGEGEAAITEAEVTAGNEGIPLPNVFVADAVNGVI